MSGETTSHAFDSGHNHVVPALVAVVIAVATLAISLMFTGLPH